MFPKQLPEGSYGVAKSLGRLTGMDVREIWPHEANDFTPWLARPENMKELATALLLGELEVEATERDVGRFSADIVAREDGEDYVLIENQLEPTDHRHLGQVLTYLAGLDGDATIVWVATQFLEEHRAAIDWLNANTNERFNFFGVEIEVVRIGASEPAPRFNVVAKPNDWSRAVGNTARRVTNAPLSGSRAFYLSYWMAFCDFYRASGQREKCRQAPPRQYFAFSSGRSGFRLALSVHRETKRVRVEVFMRQRRDPTKQTYRQLEQQRSQIEADIGRALFWEELPGKQGSRVSLSLDNSDVTDASDWPRQHKWLVDTLDKFRAAFRNRIRALQLDAQDDDPDDEADQDSAE